MKRFLKIGILFFTLFFILEKGTYYLLDKAPKREYDKRLDLVLRGQMNKDLIVLGSSRGGSNIIAKQIQEKTGLEAYNLSYQGANVIFQDFVFKTLLKFNKPPKKVVLAIDNPYEFKNEPSLQFRLDQLHPLSKYNYINNALINHGEQNILSKLFCLARVSKLTFNKVKEPLLNPFESCGSRPIIKKTKKDIIYKEGSLNYLIEDESLKHLAAFKNIQTLCKANNIELIFLFSPNYHAFNSKFKNRFSELLLPENKILIYDSLNPIYKNKDYFYDISHLNKKGAKIFTLEIADFINAN